MISTLKEFRKLFENILSENDENNKWIFRGQANPKWNFKTSLGRSYPDINEELHNKQLNVFRNELKAIKNKHKYDKPVLQLGQHYGLKTNLLDWTIDPEIALFFVLIDKEFRSKFKIFALKVIPKLVDRPQDQIPSDDSCPISIYDPLKLLDWNQVKYNFSDELIKINRNMKKQKGLFSYQNDINFDLENFYKQNPNPSIFQIIEGEIDLSVLKEINIEYPDLFTTEFFLKNACEKANLIIENKTKTN